MGQLNIEDRVKRLKNQFEAFAKDPNYKFTLETVSKEELSLLKSKEFFPPDMLMILVHLGRMRHFGHLDCHMIDWWIPCSIEQTNAEDRSAYNLSDSNFINPQNLLFFAYDCDANCYFYDTTTSPWKVVVCDGFEASCFNNEPKSLWSDWDGIITPREEPHFPDAITILENWISNT